MKRTIAIVAGGDTSEFHVSLRSAQGHLLLHRQGEVYLIYCRNARTGLACTAARRR